MRRRRILFLVPAAMLVLVLALGGIAAAAGHGSADKAASKQALVTTRKTKLGTILVNRPLRGKRCELFRAETFAAGISQQPIEAARQVNQVKSDRCGITRPGPKPGGWEAFYYGHYILSHLGQGVRGGLE